MDQGSNDNTIMPITTKSNSTFDTDPEATFIQELIPMTGYLHPDHEKTTEAFFHKNNTKQQRQLIEILESWETLLEDSNSPEQMAEKAVTYATEATDCYQKNMELLIAETKELEQSYYAIDYFFRNAGESIENCSFLNADIDQLTDLDNTLFIDAVSNELNANFDRLDLSDNYSLLVIPGYLKSTTILEKWAKIAYNNKVLLITDYRHLDAPDDVVDFFEESHITGNEPFRSNSIMTCNWLVGRGGYDMLSQQDALFIPPSTALAGAIYKGLLSQVSAGASFGVLYGAKGVRFQLKKNDLSALEELGLIPIRYEHGKTIAYSSKTLFNGDNLGLQTYSVVRVFDYVTKVLMDFLNRRTFENFNATMRKELMTEVVLFLDKNTGPGKLIDNFTINRFEQDSKDKNKIHLDVRMEPYFPSKNFLLKMNFETLNESKNWDTAIELDQ